MFPLPHTIARLLPALPLLAFLQAGCDFSPESTVAEHVARAEEYRAAGDLSAALIELKNALQKAPDDADVRLFLGTLYLSAGNPAGAEKELNRARKLGKSSQAIAVPLTRAKYMREDYQSIADEVVDETIDGRSTVSELSAELGAELAALRGHALFYLDRHDAAERQYEQSLELDPGNPEALLGKARLQGARGRFDDMRRSLQALLDAEPGFADGWNALGNLEQYLDRPEAAEAAYTEAIANEYNDARDLLNRATVRILLDKFDEAKADIEAAASKMPRNARIFFTAGLLEYRQNDYEAALTQFDEALSLARDFMPAVFYAGMSNFQLGRFEHAHDLLSQFHSQSPQSDEAAMVLAASKLKLGEYRAAESLLRPVLARNPDDEVVLDLLSAATLRQGKNDESIEYLKRALAQRPDSGDAHVRLGVGLLAAGRRDEGIEALEAATEKKQEGYGADALLIRSLLEAHEFEQALEAARRLRDREPDSPQAYNLIALAQLGLGNRAGAKAAFRRALEVSPGEPVAAHNLAVLLMKEGDFDEPRAIYGEVLEQRPGHLETLLALARLEARQGRTTQAKTRLEEAMQHNPQAWQPRVLLSRYYLRTGYPGRALAIVGELDEVHSNNPSVLIEIGTAQLETGQPAMAAETFEKLAQRQPDSAAAHYMLAKALAELDDPEGMRRELQSALEADPNHFHSNLAMVRLLLLEGKLDEAKQQLAELKNRYPERPEVLAEEGRLALSQGRADRAVELYEKALQGRPDREWTVRLAQAQWTAVGPQASIDTLNEWVTKRPADVLVLYALADAYLSDNRLDEAKAAFERVVELVPDHGLALNNLAWLLRDEDPERALEYADRALEKLPESPLVMDTYGMLLLDRGETRKSVNILRVAADRARERRDIRYHLALAMARHGKEGEARSILTEILSDDRSFDGREEAEALLRELGG